MSTIRHAWFPPTIPKRKHSVELDTESEWPSAYHALSGPAPGPRPAKRLKALEGGLAGLSLGRPGISIVTGPTPNEAGKENDVQVEAEVDEGGNQIHNASLGDGGAEPYISSIYEWASPGPTTSQSSVMSLPLKGEVQEASDEDDEDRMDARERGSRMGGEVEGTTFVRGARDGVMGYEVYEPEVGNGVMAIEKRKRGDEIEMDESEGRKKKWYEPEKDRIVVLDLDSSEDESTSRSPRRRRSAFSLSSPTSPSSPSLPSAHHAPGRPRSQTEAPEFVINPALLSHLSPVHSTAAGILSIPREDDPVKAVVLFKPAPWGTGVPPIGEGPAGTQDAGSENQDAGSET
ncbi:hypothetical protein BDV93DRAFT_505944 [Ceratobasidium sp. AG-I]|nr:hypothetical protein BDV93DRAFT_505944 [Ceratobasidium sp. AG-I]